MNIEGTVAGLDNRDNIVSSLTRFILELVACIDGPWAVFAVYGWPGCRARSGCGVERRVSMREGPDGHDGWVGRGCSGLHPLSDHFSLVRTVVEAQFPGPPIQSRQTASKTGLWLMSER